MKSKHKIDLIPLSCKNNRIKNLIADKVWWDIALEINTNEHFFPRDKCLACGVSANVYHLSLVETWHFDDRNRKQTLTGFTLLCLNCLKIYHFDDLINNGADNDDIISMLKHLAYLNRYYKKSDLIDDFDITKTINHLKKMASTWKKRSKHPYNLDISILSNYLSESKIHHEWLNEPTRYPSCSGKLDAILWAKKIINQKETIIVDFETTGLLNKENVEIIQASATDLQGRTLFNYIVKPKYTIPKEASDIHGITDHDVNKKPSFKKIHKKIFNHLKNKTVISYYTGFDKEVLHRTCKMYDLPDIPVKQWFCAKRVNAAFSNFFQGYYLPNSSHDAVDDCKAALALLYKIAYSDETSKKYKEKIPKLIRSYESFNNNILTIELVPSTAWYTNVRSLVSEEDWNILRKHTYREANYRCKICGAGGEPPHCHEVWSYNDIAHTQRLQGLIALCPQCHEVKHIGYANTQGRGQRAKEHLAHINGWTKKRANEYVKEQFKTWEERSQHDWEIDISWLKDQIKRISR